MTVIIWGAGGGGGGRGLVMNGATRDVGHVSLEKTDRKSSKTLNYADLNCTDNCDVAEIKILKEYKCLGQIQIGKPKYEVISKVQFVRAVPSGGGELVV